MAETRPSPGSPEEWRERTHAPAAERRPERRPAFQTPSGLPLEPLYGPAPDGGWPGEYPYTRGVQPTMYRGRLWTMRQYAGFSSARATNERFRLLLEGGQTGLSTAFDLPTQLGFDSDDPLAAAEVGKVGVPVNSIADLDELFEEIPLDQVSVSMTVLVLLLVCWYNGVGFCVGVCWFCRCWCWFSCWFRCWFRSRIWSWPPSWSW